MNITEEILYERLKKWQDNPVFHELTCGNDSKHNLLVPYLENGKAVLKCTDCEYTQDRFPKLFYNDNFDKAYAQQEEMQRFLNKSK